VPRSFPRFRRFYIHLRWIQRNHVNPQLRKRNRKVVDASESGTASMTTREIYARFVASCARSRDCHMIHSIRLIESSANWKTSGTRPLARDLVKRCKITGLVHVVITEHRERHLFASRRVGGLPRVREGVRRPTCEKGSRSSCRASLS